MAYNATILLYLKFTAAMLICSVILHFNGRRAASSAILRGLIGSAVAFVVTPPLAVLAGIIPDMWIQRKYFTQPFLPGCILPSVFLILYATFVLGVLGGFGAGIWLGFKNRKTQAA